MDWSRRSPTSSPCSIALGQGGPRQANGIIAEPGTATGVVRLDWQPRLVVIARERPNNDSRSRAFPVR